MAARTRVSARAQATGSLMASSLRSRISRTASLTVSKRIRSEMSDTWRRSSPSITASSVCTTRRRDACSALRASMRLSRKAITSVTGTWTRPARSSSPPKPSSVVNEGRTRLAPPLSDPCSCIEPNGVSSFATVRVAFDDAETAADMAEAEAPISASTSASPAFASSTPFVSAPSSLPSFNLDASPATPTAPPLAPTSSCPLSSALTSVFVSAVVNCAPRPSPVASSLRRPTRRASAVGSTRRERRRSTRAARLLCS